tara:strand:- start:2825 stop:2968 length:144 start_codon:yes stop_codon:yes gene_type:complete
MWQFLVFVVILKVTLNDTQMSSMRQAKSQDKNVATPDNILRLWLQAG